MKSPARLSKGPQTPWQPPLWVSHACATGGTGVLPVCLRFLIEADRRDAGPTKLNFITIISQPTAITPVRSLFVRWDRRLAGLLFNNPSSTKPNCIFLCQLEIIKKTGGTPVTPNCRFTCCNTKALLQNIRWNRRLAGLLFNNLTFTEPNCTYL